MQSSTAVLLDSTASTEEYGGYAGGEATATTASAMAESERGRERMAEGEPGGPGRCSYPPARRGRGVDHGGEGAWLGRGAHVR
jgi:hypothetical protein